MFARHAYMCQEREGRGARGHAQTQRASRSSTNSTRILQAPVTNAPSSSCVFGIGFVSAAADDADASGAALRGGVEVFVAAPAAADAVGAAAAGPGGVGSGGTGGGGRFLGRVTFVWH